MLKLLAILFAAVISENLLLQRTTDRGFFPYIRENKMKSLFWGSFIVLASGIEGLFCSLPAAWIPALAVNRILLLPVCWLLSALVAVGLMYLGNRLAKKKWQLERKCVLSVLLDAFLPAAVQITVCGAQAPLTALLYGLCCGVGSLAAIAVYGSMSCVLETVSPAEEAPHAILRRRLFNILAAGLILLVFVGFSGVQFGGNL